MILNLIVPPILVSLVFLAAYGWIALFSGCEEEDKERWAGVFILALGVYVFFWLAAWTLFVLLNLQTVL